MGGWAIGRFAAARAGAAVTLDEPQFSTLLVESPKGEVEVVLSVRGGQLATYTRMSLRDNWIAKARHEDALGQEQLAHTDRLGGLTQDHGDDGGIAGQRLEAERQQLLPEIARVLMQPGDELGMRRDVADGGECT